MSKFTQLGQKDLTSAAEKVKYLIVRPKVESSSKLEKRITKYARMRKIRMSRARRQLIEKGLMVVETKSSKKKKTFWEKIKRL